jgi:type IV secretory pathway VirB6-like protein
MGLWIKMMVYHLLQQVLLGPFTYLIVVCFDGHFYAGNLNMGCSKAASFFKVVDALTYLFFVISTAVLAYERHTHGTVLQDLMLYVVAICNMVFRLCVIATRHSLSAHRVQRIYRTEEANEHFWNSQFLLRRWAAITPDVAEDEIEKCILANDISEKHLTFRVLNPVYPPVKSRL